MECNRCGTILNPGYTYCALCRYENKGDIERFAADERENARKQARLIYEANKAGFKSIEEHEIWKEIFYSMQRTKLEKLELPFLFFLIILLPAVSLFYTFYKFSSWYLIFKLMFSGIIYICLYKLTKYIFESIENYITSFYHNIAMNSELWNDNGKLRNSIITKNWEESSTGNNSQNIKIFEENKNLEKPLKQYSKVISLNNIISIEFEPNIDQNQIEQIRAYVKTITSNNSKKIVVNGEGKNIRNLNQNDLKLLINFLETLSIFTKNKNKYK